jgi:hypothetical protein
VKTTKPQKNDKRERKWLSFSDGCIHGIRHSEVVVVRSRPHRSLVRSSVSVFTVSRALAWVATLAAGALLLLLFFACEAPHAQRGGESLTRITRPGHTNAVRVSQSENPKEPTRQTVESEQTLEYVLPPGTCITFPDGRGGLFETANSNLGTQAAAAAGPANPTLLNRELSVPGAILRQPVPVKCTTKDRTETSIGGAQKDLVREWAGKAANMQPVMWVGIVMMTVIAGILVYFGWWTKAAVAVAVGLMMIVLAQTLPGHGGTIAVGGLAVFGGAALLILYAYYKGRLDDRNRNGIPDVLEKNSGLPY